MHLFTVQRQKPAVNRARVSLANVQTAMHLRVTVKVRGAGTDRVRFKTSCCYLAKH